ncbi:hypothetical protein FDECE_13293 [Fusarium decemcellulare]|nr:hypothetical protein FDECE_13293 [Fusarium decemcellulare]
MSSGNSPYWSQSSLGTRAMMRLGSRRRGAAIYLPTQPGRRGNKAGELITDWAEIIKQELKRLIDLPTATLTLRHQMLAEIGQVPKRTKEPDGISHVCLSKTENPRDRDAGGPGSRNGGGRDGVTGRLRRSLTGPLDDLGSRCEALETF